MAIRVRRHDPQEIEQKMDELALNMPQRTTRKSQKRFID